MRNFGSLLGQNFPFDPKDDFLGEFNSSDFLLLLVPYNFRKFEKKSIE